MQVLNAKDTLLISGGVSQAVGATVLTVAVVTMAMLPSFIMQDCRDVVVYNDVITPLYDAYGFHYADKVDTYKEVKRVCR